MKKTVLLLLLFLSLSCSNDDSKDTKVVEQGCYMKVISIGTSFTGNVPVHDLQYGTSHEDLITIVVSESVYRFYITRANNGNDRWIGEVDHE